MLLRCTTHFRSPTDPLITTRHNAHPTTPLAQQAQTYGVKLDEPERTNDTAGKYAAAAEALAAELGLPCLNLWREFQRVPGWQQALLCDGLHLTEAGNAEVYRLLQGLINQHFPELRCGRGAGVVWCGGA